MTSQLCFLNPILYKALDLPYLNAVSINIIRMEWERCLQFCPDCWQIEMLPVEPARPRDVLGKQPGVTPYSQPATNNDWRYSGKGNIHNTTLLKSITNYYK